MAAPAPIPAPRDAAPPDEPAAREWTARAVGSGLAVGALLAVGNLYMGLKTGFWDSGHITASILAFGLAALLPGRRRLSLLENNVAQSAATAVGAAPATLNLLGAVPALALAGGAEPGWAAAGLGLALAVLGVLWALALRRRLLEEEKLPFPTGVATAEVIRALGARGGAQRPGRALAWTGLAAAAITLARDLRGWLPQALFLPVRVAGVPAQALGLGVALSPMLLGVGAVAGPRTGLSVLAGAAVGWGAIAPALVRSGAVPAAGYAPLVGWLAWPGVGLMLGAALVSIASQWRAFTGALRDLRRLGPGAPAGRDRRLATILAAVAALAAVALAGPAFGMGPASAAVALALGLVLAAVCARAVGQTDILPAGEMGRAAQVAMGGVGTAPADLGAGALAAGPSAQAGVALWSLRAGQLLGASVRLQARALLAGTLVGAAVAFPVYRVLVRAHGIGTAALPAPYAVSFRAVAELVARGGAALPPGALTAAVAGLATGAALEAAARLRIRGVPSPGALGMGFIAPAQYAVAIAAGAVAGAIWRRRRPAEAEELAPAVGAGAIAGESVAGAVVAVGAALAASR
ncbi:MAG TPA: OPT/YSL family transporter [Anaeromyxobacteraceae bacterium]|nr:OPT/YSL family transporter [Anaeromyxobacteraceae bacterium]